MDADAAADERNSTAPAPIERFVAAAIDRLKIDAAAFPDESIDDAAAEQNSARMPTIATTRETVDTVDRRAELTTPAAIARATACDDVLNVMLSVEEITSCAAATDIDRIADLTALAVTAQLVAAAIERLKIEATEIGRAHV